MTLPLFSPSDAVDPTKVRRSKDGRPYVKLRCPLGVGPLGSGEVVEADAQRIWASFPGTCIDGRIPSEKRPGKTVQCPKCKGKGYVEVLYTRCTSFTGALEERTNLEKWKMRTVLVGLGVDQMLLNELDMADPDDRDALDAIADKAFVVGEGHEKAQKGTDLHTLTEYVDNGWDLPAVLVDHETGQERPVTLQDRADLAAWVRIMAELNWATEAAECFVVQDDYQIGGTFDRKGVPLFHPCPEHCGGAVILDLKTGRIDYGAGKMAQQLAVYANSRDYDPETGERFDQDVCTHYGLIVHLPQGTGEASVHVVDLVAGWEAVKLSSQVREHRRMSKHMMWPLASHGEVIQ